MPLFEESPTKSQLAKLLTDTQLQEAIKKYQPKNAEWASKERPRAQFVAFITLKTLFMAAIDMFEDKKDAENVTELKKYLAELEKDSNPVVVTSSGATNSNAETISPALRSTQIAQRQSIGSKTNLVEHIAVLIAAGLMTFAEAKEIKSFWDLCPRNHKDEFSGIVTDNVNAVDFDEEKGDIIRLSDGYCYSKSSMLEFLTKGSVEKKTGRPVLPLSLEPIKDADYKVLGVSPPTAAQIRAARSAQSDASFQQLIAGDVEAWRAGTAAARPEFALLITDTVERQRLDRELGETQQRRTTQTTRNLPPRIYSNIINDTPNVALVTIPARILPKKSVFATGFNHTIAIDEEGDVFGYGGDPNRDNRGNEHGQIMPVPERDKSFVAVAVGTTHSIGLLEDGTVIGWGNNENGRAKDGQLLANRKKFIAIAAGNAHSLGLLEDGTVIGWGDNTYGQAKGGQALTGGLKIIDIAAGSSHSLAILENGKVIGWGNNTNGQAKGGEAASQGKKFIRIAGGVKYSLGILENGQVVGWGFDQDGQASQGQSKVDARPVDRRAKFIDIAAGNTVSGGLLADGSLVQWGKRNYIGRTAPLATGNRVRAVSITPSDVTTVMLNDRYLLYWDSHDWYSVAQEERCLRQV